MNEWKCLSVKPVTKIFYLLLTLNLASACSVKMKPTGVATKRSMAIPHIKPTQLSYSDNGSGRHGRSVISASEVIRHASVGIIELTLSLLRHTNPHYTGICDIIKSFQKAIL